MGHCDYITPQVNNPTLKQGVVGDYSSYLGLSFYPAKYSAQRKCRENVVWSALCWILRVVYLWITKVCWWLVELVDLVGVFQHRKISFISSVEQLIALMQRLSTQTPEGAFSL